MKRFIGFSLIVAVVLLSGCARWKEVAHSTKTDDRAYTGMYFDGTHALAVGYSGLIRYSADGGKNWSYGHNSSMCMFSCSMLDAATYFASGNGNDVIFSKDAGKSWDHLTDIIGRGKSLSFIDRSNGWASSKTWLGETRDGGTTWLPVALPADASMVETVLLTAPGSGYLVSPKGVLFHTSDSGASWDALSTPFPLGDPSFRPSYTKDNQGIALAIKGKNGFVAAIGLADKKPALVVRSTTDGGKTWGSAEKHLLKGQPVTVSISPVGLLSVFLSDSTIVAFKN
jgi:photosystem II stability/assembly factor-like uncharacterized protein